VATATGPEHQKPESGSNRDSVRGLSAPAPSLKTAAPRVTCRGGPSSRAVEFVVLSTTSSYSARPTAERIIATRPGDWRRGGKGRSSAFTTSHSKAQHCIPLLSCTNTCGVPGEQHVATRVLLAVRREGIAIAIDALASSRGSDIGRCHRQPLGGPNWATAGSGSAANAGVANERSIATAARIGGFILHVHSFRDERLRRESPQRDAGAGRGPARLPSLPQVGSEWLLYKSNRRAP